MHSHLVITTAATELALLTSDERREAVGVTDGAHDARLLKMDRRCAAAIMTECNIAVGAGGSPTLWRETLTETLRGVRRSQIVLARRHEVTVTSIVADDVLIDPADYLVDPESGILQRLSDDNLTSWSASKIVIVYEAGFSAIPDDLRQVAMDFLHAVYLEQGRDPLVKSERTDIPGVMEQERQYWVGSIPGQSNEGAVPDIVAGQLKRFRNGWIG